MPLFPSILSIAALLAFAGCASQPLVIDRRHPASAEAPEAPSRPPARLPAQDEATRITHDLLAARDTEAKAAENEPATSQAHEHRH